MRSGLAAGTIHRPHLFGNTVQRSHPGWWMSAGAAVAWIALIAQAISGLASSHTGSPAMSDMPAMAAMSHDGNHRMDGAGHAGVGWAWSCHWMLMVAAMMWPLYAMPTAAIARASFRRWRVVSVGAFVVAISALWLVFGFAARAVYLLGGTAVAARVWSTSWLVVAMAATLSAWRARALRKCSLVGVQAPYGRRALVTAAHTATRQWPRCMVLCGPVMVAMVAAHQLPLMLGGSAAVLWEQRHPRAWRDPVPLFIMTATAVAVAASSLWQGTAALML